MNTQNTQTLTVYWYSCNCEWATKYCDDYHRSSARIPLEVLSAWANTQARTSDEC